MIEFVNTGNDAVSVYKPEGSADSVVVMPGQKLLVSGEITAELSDAYVVGSGDNARLWPKARWVIPATPKPEAPSAPAKKTKD